MGSTFKTMISALAVGLALSTSALAGGFDVNVTSTDLALRGVDPVSYFTEGAPRAGQIDVTAEYNGAIYRFASEENRQAFQANPAKYAPQYGGYCAFGLSKGFKFDGDPSVWKIVDDKLYLNLSPAVAEIWQKDTAGLIPVANTEWDRVKDIDPAELQP